MEILQAKIYSKNDNFNLEEGKSYSNLKSSFIIKQINDKVGKIYITDSLGYCIKIFDIELNDEIKALSRNLEEYKLKVTELLTDQKSSLTQLINTKSADVEGIKTTTNELKESVKEIKKKLPKSIIWENSKIKLKLQDDTLLETIQINIVTENTKIKSFTYDAGVFKITDTNNTVFSSNTDLTQIFAPKIHNHDTEYVKLNDARLTNERVASDVHPWAKQRNKPVYNWTEIHNKPELNYLPLTGGMITPSENNFREGIRIGDKDGWSLLQLGAVNTYGTTENSWTITKKPNNSFQISNGNILPDTKKGLNLTANTLTFSDNTNNLLEVTNESVHTNKVFDAPYIRIHQSGSDYISLNSKDYKLNVKVGSGNRDSGEFKPVLASGYEVPNGTQTRLLAADGQNYGLGVGQKQTINLKGLNENKYYLVYCTVTPSDRVRVRVQNALNYTSKPSWSTHDGGFSLVLDFEQTGDGWGTINSDIVINKYYYQWSNAHPVMYVSQLSNSNTMFMYLRGGGEYYVYKWSQIGDSANWTNPRKDAGEYENSGQKLPYCRDWDESLKVVVRKFIAGRNETYNEWTKYEGKIISKGLIVENYPDTARFQLTSNMSEMFVTTANITDFVKIRADGYKKQGSSEDHFLLGNGEHEHRKFIGRCGEISSNWTITQSWYGQSINILAQCNVNLSSMENNFNISFRKCFAGGQVTFTTNGKTVIFTGDNQFNGGDGSTCVVSSTNNKLYIDIRNI